MNNKNDSPSSAPSRRGSTHMSPFFKDLASPICSSSSASRYHRLPSTSTAGGAGGGATLSTTPPPPPLFTLDDISPERDLPSPSNWTPPVLPSSSIAIAQSSSPFMLRLEEASGSGGSDMAKAKGKGLAEEHVIQPQALILKPNLEDKKTNGFPNGGPNEDQWVTVFGFYPSDTNLVLREFEKCGVILRHITGPRDANWVHILYQNCYDARRALERNSTQINSSLIVGVKLVDQMEKKILNEKINSDQKKSNQNGFMVSTLPAVRGKTNTVIVSGPHRSGNIAAPAKSIVTKALDLVFGM